MEFTPSSVDFKWLRESGMYDEKMLDEIEKNQTFESLKNPDMANKLRDEKIALPLLYACCRGNDHRLCEIYKYIGYEVQNNLKDIDLSRRILLNVESLDGIKKTPLARDEKLILECVTIRSDIVGHISDDLMKDGEFVAELSEKGPAVVKEMAKNYPVEDLIAANPVLANNPQFMAEAISKDVNAIKYMNKEMLNNYEVFREAAKNNKEIISYTLQNSEQLGLDAITAVKDTSRENVQEKAQEIIQNDINNNENSQLREWGKDQKRYEEMNKNSSNAIRDAAMLSQLDKVEPKVDIGMNKEHLDSIRLTILRIERALQEDPNYEIELSDVAAISQIKRVEKRMIGEFEKEPELMQIIECCKESYAKIKEIYKEQRAERAKIIRKNFEELREIEEEVKKTDLEKLQSEIGRGKKEETLRYVGEVRGVVFDAGNIGKAQITVKGKIPLSPEVEREIIENGLPSIEIEHTEEPVKNSAGRSVITLREQSGDDKVR